MATNKKKESAALFELIGKSTLKVPKNAGALKIPNWWSSKANPTVPAAAAPAKHSADPTESHAAAPTNGHASPAANGTPDSPRPAVATPTPMARRVLPQAPAAAPAPAPPAESPAQTRLFESPPIPPIRAGGVPPLPAPSIRPPPPPPPVVTPSGRRASPLDNPVEPQSTVQVSGIGLVPAAEPPATSATPAGATSAPTFAQPMPAPGVTMPMAEEEVEASDLPLPPPAASNTSPVSATSSPPGAGPTRVFAPQTYDHGRPGRTWSPPRAGSFARLPTWVLGSALGGVLLVIFLLVYLIHAHNKSASANPSPATQISRSNIPSNNANNDNPSLIPGGGGTQGRGIRGGQGGPNPGVGFANPPQPIAGAAAVFEPNTIMRQAELLYIIIASTPSRDVAERNAKFIADHGVDVSIEGPSSKSLYTLVSVQGFDSRIAAEPLRDKIVNIGHLTQDYKTRHKAWDDAYPAYVVRAAAPGR